MLAVYMTVSKYRDNSNAIQVLRQRLATDAINIHNVPFPPKKILQVSQPTVTVVV